MINASCYGQDVDEKLLYDTFSAFGGIVSNPKVMLYLDLLYFFFPNVAFAATFYDVILLIKKTCNTISNWK